MSKPVQQSLLPNPQESVGIPGVGPPHPEELLETRFQQLARYAASTTPELAILAILAILREVENQ